MSGPIVIPENSNRDRPELQRVLKFWRDLLADAELVDRGMFFNHAEYEDIRIPKLRRRWWFGKKEWIDPSKSENWERETESYLVAIPVGGRRRVGMEMCFSKELLTIALEELRKRPVDFPSLRYGPSQFGGGEDVWWGKDITALWTEPRTLEAHRAIGRAFGYREDRILETYPDEWVDA